MVYEFGEDFKDKGVIRILVCNGGGETLKRL